MMLSRDQFVEQIQKEAGWGLFGKQVESLLTGPQLADVAYSAYVEGYKDGLKDGRLPKSF